MKGKVLHYFGMVIHKSWVFIYLLTTAIALVWRGLIHDMSKFTAIESKGFAEVVGKLKTLTYGSEEYKFYLKKIQKQLDHHYANNRHHPEFFEEGIKGMSLVDLLEMMMDWRAAVKRHADGDILSSIEKNKERFGYDEFLASVFRNTVCREDRE